MPVKAESMPKWAKTYETSMHLDWILTRPMKRKEFVELWNDHISQLCKSRVKAESMRPSEAAMTAAAAPDEALQVWRKYHHIWAGQTVEQTRQFLQEIRTKAVPDINAHE